MHCNDTRHPRNMFPTWHHLRLSLMITLTTAWAWRSDENYASGHLAMVMVRVCSSPSHCQSSFLPPAPSLSPSCPVLASQSVTPSIPHFHFFLLNFPSNNFRSLATHPLQDACFTKVYKFETITPARRCHIHLRAGVIDTCTQVYMTLARRCTWHLLAGV